jgi:hypothetical protein
VNASTRVLRRSFPLLSAKSTPLTCLPGPRFAKVPPTYRPTPGGRFSRFRYIFNVKLVNSASARSPAPLLYKASLQCCSSNKRQANAATRGERHRHSMMKPDLLAMSVKWDASLLGVLAVTLLALSTRFLFSTARAYLHLRALPSPPTTSWLGGHIGMLQHPRGHRLIQQACRQLGGAIALRIFWRPVRLSHLCPSSPGALRRGRRARQACAGCQCRPVAWLVGRVWASALSCPAARQPTDAGCRAPGGRHHRPLPPAGVFRRGARGRLREAGRQRPVHRQGARARAYPNPLTLTLLP